MLFLPQPVFSQLAILYDTLSARKDSLMVTEILKSEGMMNEGLKIGVWERWYSNGQLCDSGKYAIYPKNSIRFYDADNSAFSYADTANIRMNLNDKYALPAGKWVSYYRNGRVQETGSYLPSGIVRMSATEMIDKDGELKNIYVFTEPEGVKTGVWTYFNDEGEMLWQENYINGVKIAEVPVEENDKFLHGREKFDGNSGRLLKRVRFYL